MIGFDGELIQVGPRLEGFCTAIMVTVVTMVNENSIDTEKNKNKMSSPKSSLIRIGAVRGTPTLSSRHLGVLAVFWLCRMEGDGQDVSPRPSAPDGAAPR